MESAPGTYLLILRAQCEEPVRIGRWGVLSLRPGYYLYCGSAFGPGGVRARVARHARQGKAAHWHVDHLRARTVFFAAWYSHAPERLEHRWANTLAAMHGPEAVDGFGCSDCHCRAHLFFSAAAPSREVFERATGVTVHVWRPVAGSP
ncbi:GIY-YIG nuclease family protein [Arhodomonas sp. SL1]|uniref:GIY-YIG nuclease family protein n=1 Tax=Arhodomonas sp. SL1 TaxID=3425691 RepID=UPI003F88178B